MNRYRLTNGKRVRATNQEEALRKAGFTEIYYSTSSSGTAVPYSRDKNQEVVLANYIVSVDGSDKYMPWVWMAIVVAAIIIAIW